MDYGLHIVAGVVLVFVNLLGIYYLIARWLFLRDAGRKLTHIDRQLRSAPGLHDDLRRHFQKSCGELCRSKIHVGTTPEMGRPEAAPVAWTDPRDLHSVAPRDVFAQGLDLPRGLDREPVSVGNEQYDLRGSEVRALATVGAFRVVPVDDLRTATTGLPTCGTATLTTSLKG